MNTKNIVLGLIFVLIGIVTRTVFHLGPNIEFITAISISSGFFLRGKLSFFLPVIIMFITDLLIGNTNIFIFTWSAFLIGPMIGTLIRKELEKAENKKEISLFVYSQLGGIISTIIFFLWTNLGVMILSDMYPISLSGLIQTYINAVPFLRVQLLSNFLIVPIFITTVYFLIDLKINKNIINNNV